MGLLTAPLTLVRAPVRVTLRVWEVGLSTAAEAARIAQELLAPEQPPPDFARRTPPSRPEPVGNGGPPPAAAPVAEPPPSEDAASPDVPPAVPEELVPDHVDEEPVLVAEVAEEGAEDGAGAELRVEPPWDGYDRMNAADIRDRLAAATPVEAAAVELYESMHKNRRTVMDAAARALKS